MSKKKGRKTMIYTVGADQRDAWKAALAQHARQQRQQRWKRRRGVQPTRPGMIRIPPQRGEQP